jgi:AcrR family transcriptional regulator
MPAANSTPKAGETSLKILDAALELFREAGFDRAAMRDIATKAGAAAGAAYDSYASQDAIVMASCERGRLREMPEPSERYFHTGLAYQPQRESKAADSSPP